MQRRLRSPIYAARPTIAIGGPLLDEMMPTRGQVQFQEKVEFLRALPEFRIPRATLESIRLEVADAMQGTTSAMFYEVEDNRLVLEGLAEEGAMESVRQMKANKDLFGRREKQARSGLAETVGTQKNMAAVVQEWFKDPTTVIDEWARDEMRRRVRQFGLPRNELRWPSPRDLPTVWHMWAYRCARIFLLNRDGRAIDQNDYVDWEHYWSAAHCDVLVVDDRGFRQVVELCPPPKPRLLSFAEWCGELTA